MGNTKNCLIAQSDLSILSISSFQELYCHLMAIKSYRILLQSIYIWSWLLPSGVWHITCNFKSLWTVCWHQILLTSTCKERNLCCSISKFFPFSTFQLFPLQVKQIIWSLYHDTWMIYFLRCLKGFTFKYLSSSCSNIHNPCHGSYKCFSLNTLLSFKMSFSSWPKRTFWVKCTGRTI